METYIFMAEIGDRRTKKYKLLDAKLDSLVKEFGKESKEVNDFFNQSVEDNLKSL